jgi:DNA-binding transcriptional MerR regulator
MFKAFPLVIPDEVLDWTGSASDLADKCNEILGTELEKGAGAANERLVRHYVQVDVLSPPVRQGREAVFGARQVFEIVVARYLLNDGWPLAKIAELVKTYDLPESRVGGGKAAAPTEAEQAIARIREAGSPDATREHDLAPSVSALRRAFEGVRSYAAPPLEVAAAASMRRLDLAETLRALGNPAGEPERAELVRIRLTPWCAVDVDTAQLRRFGPELPDVLGQALAQALHQERLNKGERK